MEEEVKKEPEVIRVPVLIVQPDAALALNMMELIISQARRYGFSISAWATNTFVEALSVIDNHDPRLILTDMDFPMEDGSALISENGIAFLRSLRACEITTPAIVVSKYTQKSVMRGLKGCVNERDVFHNSLIMPWLERAIQILHLPHEEALVFHRPKPVTIRRK